MITATFEGWIARSNTNGGVWHTPGARQVFVDIIPADAPRDWGMGPKMVPGQFGCFLGNAIHPRGHSPYAFATGKTEEEARLQAGGFFRSAWANGKPAKLPEWITVQEPEFAWEEE